jgi:LAO/AO transport system kinase
VVAVLDAFGKDVVLLETVGAGQDEVAVASAAQTTLVINTPGTGDDVQTLKAGIMEIADIFVVNKADREGSDRTVMSIQAIQAMHAFADGEWRPPIVKTEATTGAGVPELVDLIEKFRQHTVATQGSRRRARAEWRLRELLGHRFIDHVEKNVLKAGEFEQILERIAARETDPYSAVDAIFARAVTRARADG